MLNDIFNPGYRSRIPLLAVFAVLLLAAVFCAGWFFGEQYAAARITPRSPELRMGEGNFGYRYINPLLACSGADNPIDDRELRPFKDKVVQLIESRKKQGLVSDVSMQFQEMDNGSMFTVNADDRFAPASLLKVPYMIAYFKWAELKPAILKRKIIFDKSMNDLNDMQNFKPAQIMERGKSYTIDDLIFRAITFSDNNALYLLGKYIPVEMLHRTYNDLGVPYPGTEGHEELSISQYASFFRMLFNASYLTREFSEKALTYLAEPDFPMGIQAGVPDKIIVAQKFGERIMGDQGEIKQLHDCGIIYYPSHPYLLCIMTSGASFDPLVGMIRDISHLVYQEIDSQYRNRPAS
ncbi:MAG TPA: serine hydrolase [Nitrospirota bacterium]